MNIVYIDRLTGKKKIEKVYKKGALEFLYGDRWFTKSIGPAVLPLVAKLPYFSQLYGILQKQPNSAKKIQSFITKFEIDPAEFLEPIENFQSFNDFFIRKLKKDVRPIDLRENVAIIPADARYYFYQNMSEVEGFIVKDKKFLLSELLENDALAKEYADGSMVMARLCPSDYHRFHFPVSGVAKESKLINGWLFSVNPIAIKKNIEIFTQNKRTLCEIESDKFGKVLYLAIGATNVGSIQDTYQAGSKVEKGDEKGYFEFGASALILLFKKNCIQFDAELIEATKEGLEIRCLFGQSMGSAIAIS